MTTSIFDIIGMSGVAVILITYLLLQLEKMQAADWRYSALNGIGAVLILISLTHTFNLASFMIETAWLLISLFGLFKAWRTRHYTAQRETEHD